MIERLLKSKLEPVARRERQEDVTTRVPLAAAGPGHPEPGSLSQPVALVG